MTDARVFISYARADGTNAARALRQRLSGAGLSVWQDLAALQGGRDWWSQIEEALRSKSLEHLVLMLTPDALSRKVIRDEIRLARQEGKQVHPICGPGLDPSTVPRWIGHVIDVDIPEQWDRLIIDLKGPSRQARVPMMAPELPADFVPRPKEFDELKRALLADNGEAKGGGLAAITAALRGAGGYGKTTLAKALAHDPDVQEAFNDGILWAPLGEKPANLLSTLIDLIQRITGERPALETLNAAASALGETLGDKRILLVVDDCWNSTDLQPFLQGGKRTTRLVTTRLDRVLPVDAFRLPVDAMQSEEAFDLLKAGLVEAPAHRAALQALASRLGEWAQLLKLVNGFLRNRVRSGEMLAAAIVNVDRRLDEKGLTAFDAREEGDRTQAIARTIEVSLELLDEGRRARFAELGVFPEDVDVPIDVATALWAKSAGLGDIDAEDLLTELEGLSLLLGLDLDRRTFRFHDTTRAYLRAKAGKEGLIAHAAMLVSALEGRTSDAARRYDLLYRPEHLHEAGDRAALEALLTDPAWIEEKFTALGGVNELVGDYQRYANPHLPLHGHLGAALRLAGPCCARDPRQFLPQLHGRLISTGIAAYSPFLSALKARAPHGALFETRPALSPPGAETARLECHEGSINALTVLPDGRLASALEDYTIRLWDLASGAETGRLEGHEGAVLALAVLPDGRLASGADDHTIRLWDLASGAETVSLEGHGGEVNALAVLPDGRLASGSSDKTIRLWDLSIGAETGRLEGHHGAVSALQVLPDGRLASGALGGTICLWDVASGAETGKLEGHDRRVTSLAVLPDGRLASGSVDRSIRLWDLAKAAETARLEGHDDAVTALAVLPDGRLASSCGFDHTIRRWDLASGGEVEGLVGHVAGVIALAVLPDGRLASGSHDKTIRLWAPASGAAAVRLEGHGGWVNALAVLPDGCLASGSDELFTPLGEWELTSRSRDRAVSLWDVANGAKTARLEGHRGGVNALAVLPDGRLASGSSDDTIRLWDLTKVEGTRRLGGHDGAVLALQVLPDGRLASGSDDYTIRLWDLASGTETGRLEGHNGWVRALAVLPDGRLASGSDDRTIRFWDPTSGTETGRLEGHDGWVMALQILPDGRLASGSEDYTIRLWDLTSCAEARRLDGHNGWVRALAVLPDGGLASGADDHTIRLWDLASGAETARLELDDAVSSLAALPGGRLVAGDGLGRLHWLAIKGEDGEVGRQSSFAQRAPLSPPGAMQTPPRDMAQPTGPLTLASALSDTHPPGNKSAAELTGEPATKPPRKKQSAPRLLFVVLALALITALMVAAVFLGPAYGVPHARDAWDAALELLASWH